MDNEVNGGSFIPASQRPDGTWRKPRRVKEGYVPQEEVPLYESKGKQFMNRKPIPIGMSGDAQPHRSIPGLFIDDEKVKKEKKKPKPAASVEEVRKTLQQTKISEPPALQIDPAKKLKNLRKRLREIDALELKIKSGEIKNPEKEQKEKVARKIDIINEIKAVEATMNV